MLRSLVGSEMCIRDSAAAKSEQSSTEAPLWDAVLSMSIPIPMPLRGLVSTTSTTTSSSLASSPTFFSPLLRRGDKSFRSCLLYTSDAADEEDS
eukprot:TRINITY_DN40915_c0_g1_i1.p2 TRINITY_DN40915_c0_g1~~TRINITY_DN40915_c0_g1_i1.p2  ORF type:complete len:107 (-),score=57.22 TRINITY_DN40915_c0_g1_i1:38-319(-)